jgi:hypothetical protein
MKLQDIFDLWKVDVEINRNDLGEEALKLPKLHHKYFSIFTEEKLKLRSYEAELKKLRLDKYEFFTQGPSDETEALGWKLPPIGRIIKADANTYIDVDEEVVKQTLRIGIQQEKIALLDSIIRSLNTRGFLIKNAIDWARFTAGA